MCGGRPEAGVGSYGTNFKERLACAASMSRKLLAMPFIQVQLNLNWEDAYAVPYVGRQSQFEAQKRPYNKDFCDSWPELLSWLWLATEQRVRTRVACALSRRSYHWVTMTARSELRLPLTLLRRRQTTWKGQEGHRCRPGWCRPKGKLNPLLSICASRKFLRHEETYYCISMPI